MAVASLAALGATFLGTPAAHAEVGNEHTNSAGKGIVGGALVLSETVMLVEAAIGVQPWWAYALGGGLGAVAGGIGGYFIADAGTDAVPMGLLTAGLVLTIPTTIAVLSATAYQPPEADSLSTSASLSSAPRLARPRLPGAFVGWDEAGFALGVPAISVTEVYSARMRMTYALPSETEVRVPMLDVQF